MLLITGATGNIGTTLVRQLTTESVPTRILVRDPGRADHLPRSVERAVGDLEDPDSLTDAFRGVDALFLLTPGIGATMARNALGAASRAGVGHVVLLSSTNVVGDPVPAMGRWHHEREVLVRGSTIPWTILRPNGFMSNALEWAPTLAAGGYVLDATGPGRHAVIDPADIAAVAAVTLTTEGHGGATHALTGPESLTTADQVRILGRTLGVPIELREVATADEAVRSRFPNGAPEPLAAAVVEAWQLMRADTVGARTDTVERLLGRAPGSFRHWCETNVEVISAALSTASADL
jgi:uncharacterized protein YbjT (DUF2867 family)